jgi:hypothetical protein
VTLSQLLTLIAVFALLWVILAGLIWWWAR